MTTKILIADNVNLFSEGLRSLIQNEKQFEFVGTCSNAEELFSRLDETKPDVIILNLMLTGDNISTICSRLNGELHNINVLAITDKLVDPTLIEYAFMGVNGIVWRNSTFDQLTEAINRVMSGKRFFNLPHTNSGHEVIDDESEFQDIIKAFNEISSRELEVFKLFARGLSYKDIGEALQISPRTVESHKNNILAKLDLGSVKEMIAFAMKYNLIEL